MKTLVLLSGGIDSTVALAVTHADVAVSFDYGQTHWRELDAAARIAAHYGAVHHVASIKGLVGPSSLTGCEDIPESHADEPDTTEVPGRNLVMVSVAVAFAQTWGYECVVIGANADDRGGYPDCRPEFITALDDATRAGYQVGVWAPLLKMSKRDIVERGRQLGIPFDLTWSCYRGGERPCGRCGACQSRDEAMECLT